MPRFRDTCSAAMNCPWLRKPADAVVTVKPAGSSGWTRADRAGLLASRALTFPFAELFVLAAPDGTSALALSDALDFDATGASVSPIPDTPTLPCPFSASRLPLLDARIQPNTAERMID